MKHGVIDNIPDNPKEILDYAKSKSFNFWIDEKGTKKHPGVWTREESELSYEDAFKLIQNHNPHWVFSFRNISYLEKNGEDHWEFGGCNIGSNDYGKVFIWIQVKVDMSLKIFKKFNLNIKYY